MSAGITRVHGAAIPQILTGGYQIRWFKAATAGFFQDTAGTSYATADAGPNSKFEKAVRAIETVATIVVLGTPTSGGFIFGIDGATFSGRDDHSFTPVDTAVAVLDGLLETALGSAVATSEVTLTGPAFV